MKDEFAFIANIQPNIQRQSSLVKGIGDDAAVYRGSKLDEVVALDTLVEGIHFTKETLSPLQIGKKALAVNVSDLAAMGARPMYYLVSVAISSTWQEEDMLQIYAGMDSVADSFGMDLVGGDTVYTKGPLVISVTALGRVEKDRALYRHCAQKGDIVFVTGELGGSAAGLYLLQTKGKKGPFTKEEKKFIRAHQQPKPHVQASRLLVESGRRIALNDVSDGIGSEAYEIARASHVQITIDRDRLPIDPHMPTTDKNKQLQWALFGGEDFVLIGTMAKKDAPVIQEAFIRDRLPFYIIGEVSAGEPAVFLQDGDTKQKLHMDGYNHFRKRGESK